MSFPIAGGHNLLGRQYSEMKRAAGHNISGASLIIVGVPHYTTIDLNLLLSSPRGASAHIYVCINRPR